MTSYILVDIMPLLNLEKSAGYAKSYYAPPRRLLHLMPPAMQSYSMHYFINADV